MEILQFLLSFFSQEFGEKYKGLFDAIKDGNFNLINILKNITPDMIEPIFKNLFGGEKNFSPRGFAQAEGLTPIKSFADENIVATLNCYLENGF